MKNILIKLLKQKNIIKHGDFVFRSGINSKSYCDIKEAFGHPIILENIISEMVKLIPKNSTCITGSGYGGITLASLIAYKKRLPLVLARETVKDHGTKKAIEGYVPNKKDVVCVVDDVFTTGSSIRDTKERLSKLGVKFAKPVVVLNRSNKKSVLSILSIKDLYV